MIEAVALVAGIVASLEMLADVVLGSRSWFPPENHSPRFQKEGTRNETRCIM